MKIIKYFILSIPFFPQILRHIHLVQKTWEKHFFHIWPIKIAALLRPNLVYLVLTPNHGNLGDHAIAASEAQLLNQLKIPFYEVSGYELYYLRDQKKLSILNGKPILVNGGGYLGTLWPDDDSLICELVSENPGSHILLFPNTVYYDDTPLGHAAYQEAKAIYLAHPHLKSYAREMKSYQIFQQLFPHAGLAPDMALRLQEDKARLKRSGCSLFLRTDRERTRTDAETKEILRFAEELFGDNILICDTILPEDIPSSFRLQKLESMFMLFQSSELVITDRLHGMIFAAITGTPCIVINSKSPKVRGCFEWLRDLPYIRFCENLKEIASIYGDIPKGGQSYDSSRFLPFYAELFQDLSTLGDNNWPTSVAVN